MIRHPSILPFILAMAVVVVPPTCRPVPGRGEDRRPGARRHPDLGRLHLSVLLLGDRSRQPALRPGGGAPDRFVGFMLAVVCSIVVPPFLYGFIGFDTTGPAGPHRGRLGRGLPGRPAARRHRVQPATQPLLAERARDRLAGRLGARHGDILHFAFAAVFAFVGPSDTFALENAPFIGVPVGPRRRAGYRGRWAT